MTQKRLNLPNIAVFENSQIQKVINVTFEGSQIWNFAILKFCKFGICKSYILWIPKLQIFKITN